MSEGVVWVDFGVNPEGLCRVAGDFSQDATGLSYAVSDFGSSNGAASRAARESLVSAAFERFMDRWSPGMSSVVAEADSMASALARAAATAVAADLQAGADQASAVGSAAATRSKLRWSINAE